MNKIPIDKFKKEKVNNSRVEVGNGILTFCQLFDDSSQKQPCKKDIRQEKQGNENQKDGYQQTFCKAGGANTFEKLKPNERKKHSHDFGVLPQNTGKQPNHNFLQIHISSGRVKNMIQEKEFVIFERSDK